MKQQILQSERRAMDLGNGVVDIVGATIPRPTGDTITCNALHQRVNRRIGWECVKTLIIVRRIS